MAADAAGYVLVGGRSSRFGADKALLDWHGRPLAAWVAEQVRAAAGSATLIGDPGKYGGLGWPVVADRASGCGPLGGLDAALAHSTAESNLVVACDLPNLRPDFLAFLLREFSATETDVLLPVDRQGRDEPLCAVYALGCRQTIAAAIERGVRKMTDALAGLRVRRLRVSEELLFANLNTPADLAGAHVHG